MKQRESTAFYNHPNHASGVFCEIKPYNIAAGFTKKHFESERKRQNKKIIAIILMLTLAFALVACGDNGQESSGTAAESSAPAESPAAESSDAHDESSAVDSSSADESSEAEDESSEAGESSVAEAHTHAFGEWKQTKEATYTEPGVETRECSCGEKETRATEKKDPTELLKTYTDYACTLGLFNSVKDIDSVNIYDWACQFDFFTYDWHDDGTFTVTCSEADFNAKVKEFLGITVDCSALENRDDIAAKLHYDAAKKQIIAEHAGAAGGGDMAYYEYTDYTADGSRFVIRYTAYDAYENTKLFDGVLTVEPSGSGFIYVSNKKAA